MAAPGGQRLAARARRGWSSIYAAHPALQGCGPHPGALWGPFAPARPCSRRGLPGHDGYPPCRWALTPPFHPCPHPGCGPRAAGGLFLWPCPRGYPLPGFPRRRALWSADFPLRHPLRDDAATTRLPERSVVHYRELEPAVNPHFAPRWNQSPSIRRPFRQMPNERSRICAADLVPGRRAVFNARRLFPRVQANLVEAHAAGGETRPLASPFHAPRAEPASSRAILWQLAAGFLEINKLS